MRIMRAVEPVAARAPSPTSEAQKPPLAAPAQGGSFSEVLRGIGRELDRGEAETKGALRGAAAGAEMSPGALIALQAGIYRYSEVVDLAAKLVDRASSAVKTTLQNQ